LAGAFLATGAVSLTSTFASVSPKPKSDLIKLIIFLSPYKVLLFNKYLHKGEHL
jgi:hypothetical protein